MNIAIDGPAGAGKSTIAKEIAKRIGVVYVDTGAFYRVIALFVSESLIDIDNEKLIGEKLMEASIKVEYKEGKQIVILNGKDVTDNLRSEAIGNIASKISAYKVVRDKLFDLQRDIAKNYDVVMDGRDIGTVVLPDAEVKIFLTANVEERAMRRYHELKDKGGHPDFEKVKQDLIIRDHNDSTREIAPLKKADDAIELDSSNLSIDEVANKIIGYIKKWENDCGTGNS